jgi:hypothetical protein
MGINGFSKSLKRNKEKTVTGTGVPCILTLPHNGRTNDNEEPYPPNTLIIHTVDENGDNNMVVATYENDMDDPVLTVIKSDKPLGFERIKNRI